MVNAGRVGLIPKGEFDPSVKYEKLDIVSYQNKLYIAKEKEIPIGTLPTNGKYWLLSFDIDGVAKKTNPEIEGSIISNKAPYDNVIDSATLIQAVTDTVIGSGMAIRLTHIYGSDWEVSVPIDTLEGYPMPTIDTSNGISVGVIGYANDLAKELVGFVSFSPNEVSFDEESYPYAIKLIGKVDMAYVKDIHGEDMTKTTNSFNIGSTSQPLISDFNFSTDLELHFSGTNSVANESVALGVECSATGNQSQAFGLGGVAISDQQLVIGKYNIEDKENKYAFIIGNGTDWQHRSNALAIKWDGTIVTSNF